MKLASQPLDPHAARPTSIIALGRSLWFNRQLIFNLCEREIVGRYKGSIFGMAWSLFSPVLMLAVYTFIFSEVFNSRWGAGNEPQNKAQFAVVLFAGMIVLNFFSEILNRAPGIVLANVNYVKKVVFPLEVLPAIITGAALFNALVSIAVLLIAFFLFNGYLHWTCIFIPIVFLPLLVLTIGLAWILASLGVFLRDIGQSITIITTALMFLSPVFYPITAVPEAFRPLINLSPLTFIIEQTRNVLIWGIPPNWDGLASYSAAALIVAWCGYAWFQKTRRGFADVV